MARAVRKASKRKTIVLTERSVDEMVGLYARGTGEPIAAIAAAYKVTTGAVRYHLKKRGELAPQSGTADMASDNEMPSDEDLGIGDDGGAELPSLEELMAHPDFSKLVQAAVQREMAGFERQAAPAAASPIPSSEAAFNAFLSKFDHMLDTQKRQEPGYIKPLSPAEMDQRDAGKRELDALLVRYRELGTPPRYLLAGSEPHDRFYGPSPHGPILYDNGMTIDTYLRPADNWKPMNEPAMQVYAAHKKWVGEVVSIEDLVAQALLEAKQASSVAEVTAEAPPNASDVVIVDAPVRETAPTRQLGTLTPERRGKPMPGQPGVTAQPQGPIFVGGEQ